MKKPNADKDRARARKLERKRRMAVEYAAADSVLTNLLVVVCVVLGLIIGWLAREYMP